VSTVNKKAALYELATVAAVLRVAPQPMPEGGDKGAAVAADDSAPAAAGQQSKEEAGSGSSGGAEDAKS
jgi:hypothetical protein